ncbi:MAG: phospholipase [Flavobacteriales bacterium]|nr:phospholipase [Flavobacteriales bacterium]
MEEHHLSTPRTARYHTVGDPALAKDIWIVLHGYGQLARFFLRPFEGLGSGRLIAAPEGLSRFYSDIAHTRVGATWMTREDRDHEIMDQTAYLDRLADHLLPQCPPGTPLSVLGFSQGVATACRWALSSKVTMDRLVLWGGTIPPEPDASALHEKLNGTKIVLVHGEQDRLVNEEGAPAQCIALARGLYRSPDHTLHRRA